MTTTCSEGNVVAQIINFRIAQSEPQAALANKCCTRCGADVWHMRGNGEIYCADCEQSYPVRLQVSNEYLGEK